MMVKLANMKCKCVLTMLLSVVFMALPLSAQDALSTGSPVPKKSEADLDDDNIIRFTKESGDPEVKSYNSAEKQKACGKYNGKTVSISGEVWSVKNCVRHLISDADQLFRMSRQGINFIEVDAKELAPIPEGKTVEEMEHEKMRPCSTFNGRYVTYSYTDTYFVENCVRKLVPDYETLLQHRKDRKVQQGEIIALTSAEFFSLKQGRDVSSVIDKEFSKLLDGSAGVEIIPVDEACRGVEGKMVSFYSRIYKIEKCKKREIDAELYSTKNRGRESRLTELKPEQWLSLPEGAKLSP
jgi:hypothetical protein